MDKPNSLDFWVKMAKMTMKDAVNNPHFQYQQNIPGCMIGANLVILVQIFEELSRGQAKFPRILS